MSEAPYLPMYVDAMVADTMDMSAEAFGAYHLLLYAIWRNGGNPLPDDDTKLARICRASVSRWRRVLRPELIKYFDAGLLESDQKLQQKRLVKEWLFISKSRKQRVDAGNASAEARALRNKNSSSTAVDAPLPTEERSRSNGIANTSPTTHTHTKKKSPPLPPTEEPSGDPPVTAEPDGQRQDDRKAKAVAIISSFDRARAEAWGEAQRRPWPNAKDLYTALAWVDAGCTVELAGAVFDNVNHRLATNGLEPPATLKARDADIRKVLRAAAVERGNGVVTAGHAVRLRMWATLAMGWLDPEVRARIKAIQPVAADDATAESLMADLGITTADLDDPGAVIARLTAGDTHAEASL